jgi:hypothetical protein
MDAAMALPSRRMEVWFAGTTPQRRLTVLFRIFLAIPQFFVLVFLGIALFFVVVIGWFGALFMGRFPLWAHTFVTGVLRWFARVDAYLFLLTDRYPPFTFEDTEYPVRPFFPEPGRLNRWAVLFRFILVIPASVYAQIVRYGLTIPLLIVMWFVVLITGTMPPTFYVAYAALLRYDFRVQTYFLMLTSEYAWGMLGDRPAFPATPPQTAPFQTPGGAVPPAGVPPVASPPYTYPPATAGGAPPDQPGGASATPDPTAQEAESAGPGGLPAMPPPMPAPMPPPTMAPAVPPAMPPPSAGERVAFGGGEQLPPWGTLVVQGATRGWMIFAIVWGSVLFVGGNAVQSAFNHHNTNNNTNILGNTGSTGTGNTGAGNTGGTGGTGNTP